MAVRSVHAWVRRDVGKMWAKTFRPFRARLGASGGIVDVPNGSVVL